MVSLLVEGKDIQIECSLLYFFDFIRAREKEMFWLADCREKEEKRLWTDYRENGERKEEKKIP